MRFIALIPTLLLTTLLSQAAIAELDQHPTAWRTAWH